MDVDESKLSEDDDASTVEISDKFSRKRSQAWAHFRLQNKEEKLATCELCGEEFSYRYISNLTKHLKRKHKLDFRDTQSFNDINKPDDGVELTLETNARMPTVKPNKAWKYFVIQNEDQKLAQCKFCCQTVSYNTTVFNLMRHVKRRHSVKVSLSEDETDMESSKDVPKINVKKTSKAWKYFVIQNEDQKVAQCKFCYQTVSYSSTMSNLMRHVRRTHSVKVSLSEDETDMESSRDVEISRDKDNEDDCEIIEYEIVDDSALIGNENNEKRNPKYRSKVWNYFVVVNEIKKMARCKLCARQLSYSSSISNLMKHIRRKHTVRVPRRNFETAEDKDSGDKETDNIEFLDNEDEENGVDHEIEEVGLDENENNEKSNPKYKSKAWNYFVVVNEIKKRARCKLCARQLSYSSCISNLMKHIRRKHTVRVPKRNFETAEDKDSGDKESDNIEFLDNEDEENGVDHEIEEVVLDAKKMDDSSVWTYFKCVDKEMKTALCLMCQKYLSYSTTVASLWRHLAIKHRIAVPSSSLDAEEIFFATTTNGNVFPEHSNEEQKANTDVDEYGAIEMEHEYIEENNLEEDIQDPIRIQSLKNFSGNSRIKKRRMMSDSTVNKKGSAVDNDSENEVTLQTRYERERNDSIDCFGKYISSLMKQLPKTLSDRLQMDFVKQIMEAKLAISNTVPDIVAANGYTITIAADNRTVMNE